MANLSNIAGMATDRLTRLFTAPAGEDFTLNSVAQGIGAVPLLPLGSVMTGNTGAELFEQSLALRYPTVTIYCDKLSNTLKEKFRVFSGAARLIVEIRHSQDQVQQMQRTLESYVAAACEVLDTSRGDWGQGLFYAGGYDVVFSPVKRGGRNFLQAAKISLDIDVSA